MSKFGVVFFAVLQITRIFVIVVCFLGQISIGKVRDLPCYVYCHVHYYMLVVVPYKISASVGLHSIHTMVISPLTSTHQCRTMIYIDSQ